MKPQPLDFEEIEELIYKIMSEEKFPYCRVNAKARQEIMNTLSERLVPFIKQRIKSACEFYLRYKDNLELFIKEHKEYKDEIEEKDNIFFLGGLSYNEWLFKLAFKDVLEEK